MRKASYLLFLLSFLVCMAKSARKEKLFPTENNIIVMDDDNFE